MRAPLAAIAADRISRSAILVAGALCGVLVFFVAIPLALSNPFPAPKEGERLVRRSSLQVASLIPESVAIETQTLLEPAPRITEASLWDFVALPAQQGAPAFKPPEVTGSEAAGKVVDTPPAPPAPRRAASIMSEVDDYLWEVYQRAPAKRDSTGDFTWKDPAAAKRLHFSMRAYVIGGMDPDFREQLYHAGRAMDADGIHWSMLSAFRDDYRQSLASGFKAGASNSLHGGKARTGGYGHGQAVDVTSESGRSDDAVWRWIDRHGAKYGLYRPMPSADPAHVQPRGGWHKTAVALRQERVGTVAQTQLAAAKTKVVRASW
jgi:hypothetical protein